MPQKRTDNPKKSTWAPNAGEVVFRDLALDARQEEQLKSSGFSRLPYPNVLDTLIDMEMKVTFKEDARNKSIMCMVQDAVYDPANTTVIWVMRSGTARGALLKLAYYMSLTDGQLPDEEEVVAENLSDEDLFQ